MTADTQRFAVVWCVNDVASHLRKCLESIYTFKANSGVSADIVLFVPECFSRKDDVHKIAGDVRFVEVSPAYDGLFPDTGNRWSAITYYRLLIFDRDDLFQDYDAVLYLDNDTQVIDSLVQLFETTASQLEGKVISAVPEFTWARRYNRHRVARLKRQATGAGIRSFEVKYDTFYFNGGVLAFSCRNLYSNGTGRKLYQQLMQLAGIKFNFVDQDMMNIIMNMEENKLKVFRLDWRYNAMKLTRRFFEVGDDVKPMIIHHYMNLEYDMTCPEICSLT